MRAGATPRAPRPLSESTSDFSRRFLFLHETIPFFHETALCFMMLRVVLF